MKGGLYVFSHLNVKQLILYILRHDPESAPPVFISAATGRVNNDILTG